MKAGELRQWLTAFDDNLEVEIATNEYKDDWYTIFNVEADTNHQGNDIVVINTE